ncbi:FecCD family ABC transporter permease [Stackebrandtia nassauensis]|uniref:Transport system permease protein n=1 Tax=Stackebrandtia nassauensis (strain DSM 44728 / CIP 108903 / NRRL B-16338 / NBRC 102104 / LLR-40K-21) TaxID=446470 RepID=D3PWG7_STANL|nr:iron ABC transporter permease [Stackebrandtia nassauensis]ADD43189.1 transport system permease protein [Stackebrandtia nassauensis DSM 44728]
MSHDVVRLPGRFSLRVGPVSLVVRRRSAVTAGALLLVLLGAITLSVCVGDTYVTFADAVTAMATGGTGHERLINVLRLPRVVLAVAAGVAFGLAGALIQSVARNPLASPDVIGVSQGAGLAATIALTTGAGFGLLLPVSLVGGLAAAALVLYLGAKHGLAAHRFVLAGIAVAVILKSLIQIVMLAAPAIDAQRAQIWLVGTFAGRGYFEAAVIGIAVAVCLPVLVWAGKAADTTALDDDTARGLGVRVTARRTLLAVLGVVLAAVATASVGAVDFVALVAPQLARRLTGTERPPLWCAALTGAVLTVTADWLGRNVFGSYDVPAGVLTAALGGPFLIYLLIRRRRSS